MITYWRLEKELAATVGLQPFELDRLPRLVLLVGPNGSGKTRVLNRLTNLVRDASPGINTVINPFDFTDHPPRAFIELTQGTPGELQSQLEELRNALDAAEVSEAFQRIPFRCKGDSRIVPLRFPEKFMQHAPALRPH